MKICLVGFQGSGKTTVFNALTGLAAEVGAGGYGKMNVGVVKVPDPRIEALSALHHPKKKTLAEIQFADLVAPAGGGERRGFDPQSVAEMRTADALVQVVRGFEHPAFDTAPNPLKEVDSFALELVMADLEVLEKRLARCRKEGARSAPEVELLEPLVKALEAETPLRLVGLDEATKAKLAGFGLLSLKPVMVLVNTNEAEAGKPLAGPLAASLAERKVLGMALCGAMEAEIAQLPEGDRAAFLSELGLAEPGLHLFIRNAYALLDLISFLTAGPDECRAWTIRRGSKALDAAARIHSDIAKRFIRAEVVAYDDYVAVGGETGARDKGKLRLEGKEYIVTDGDVIHFRHNA